MSGRHQPLGRRALRALALAVGLILIGGLAGRIGLEGALRALGPPDLARTREGSVLVVDRHGQLLRPFTTADGRWKLPVKAGEVDPGFVALLKAYEDRRFDHHAGVDGLAMMRAAWQWLRYGRIVSGGSTLTMQLARLLEPREERSLGAKGRQMLRAIQLERMLSKAEILDHYLTLAPYGGNIEGVRAASLAYFGKEPRRLSPGEAALLVALPQSPEARRPDRSAEAARRARDRVLMLAAARGAIGAGVAMEAQAEAVPIARRPFPMLAAHVSEALVRERPTAERHVSSIDRRLQIALEGLARERVESFGPKASVAMMVVDHASGGVLASVGGPDFLDTRRAGALDLTQAVRSPGSALKPFIYAMAFEAGIAHPETMMEDRPSRHAAYAPENFDLTYQGTVSARVALQQSLNVPAVDLLQEVGAYRFIGRLRAAGADVVLPRDSAPGLALALGGLGIRLSDLARLYAGLARGGTSWPLSFRLSPDTASGAGLRLTTPVAAWYVTDVLRGTPPPLHALGGRFSYKTGTSYGYRDAWAVGYDRRVTIAVWVGRPDGAPVPGLTGRSAAAPLLFDAFARFGGEAEPLPAPPHVLFARTSDLPLPLRHLSKDVPRTATALALQPLKIAFPPDGARVDVGVSGPQERGELLLKAQGGQPPLIWLVNGRPVVQDEIRRQSRWQPDGAGFARVTVMDSTGASDSVTVRLE